jgi:hypothetical protein
VHQVIQRAAADAVTRQNRRKAEEFRFHRRGSMVLAFRPNTRITTKERWHTNSEGADYCRIPSVSNTAVNQLINLQIVVFIGVCCLLSPNSRKLRKARPPPPRHSTGSVCSARKTRPSRPSISGASGAYPPSGLRPGPIAATTPLASLLSACHHALEQVTAGPSPR